MPDDVDPSAKSEPTGPRLVSRPGDPTTLLMQGETHDSWFLANRRANRFYVVNLQEVIGKLNYNHTNGKEIFKRAGEVIATETKWDKLYDFRYSCSHTQVYPDSRFEAKDFGRAATIIVAMEMAASLHPSQMNVYEYLRILPAQYFVDRFDAAKLRDLKAYYDAMPVEEKEEKFAPDHGMTFIDLCKRRIDQEFGGDIVYQMAIGHSITKFTAEKFVNFINESFPGRLHVGGVVSSGEDAMNMKLGTKNAAPDLRVPKKMVIS